MDKPIMMLLLISLLIFSSCGKAENNLIGSWNLTSVKYFNDFRYSNFNMEDTDLAITLSKDGNFLFANYDAQGNAKSFEELFTLNNQLNDRPVHFGKWQYSIKDSIVKLNFHDLSPTISLKFDGIEKGKMNLVTTKKDSSSLRLSLMFNRIFVNDVSVSKNNYLLPKFNLWRIKSTKKETPAEVIERTIQSLNFSLEFYSYLKKNDIKIIDKSYLKPIPIHFARNGLAFKENENWENIFYDFEDYNLSVYFLKKFFDYEVSKSSSTEPYEIKIHYIKEYIKVLEKEKQNLKK